MDIQLEFLAGVDQLVPKRVILKSTSESNEKNKVKKTSKVESRNFKGLRRENVRVRKEHFKDDDDKDDDETEDLI